MPGKMLELGLEECRISRIGAIRLVCEAAYYALVTCSLHVAGLGDGSAKARNTSTSSFSFSFSLKTRSRDVPLSAARSMFKAVKVLLVE